LLNCLIPLFIVQWLFVQIGKDIQLLRKNTEIPTKDDTRDMPFLKRTFYQYLNYCNSAPTAINNPLNRFIVFTGYYAVYLSLIIWAITKPIPAANEDPANPPIPPDPNNDQYDKVDVGLTVYACAMLWQVTLFFMVF
jgi:hypothetical protein